MNKNVIKKIDYFKINKSTTPISVLNADPVIENNENQKALLSVDNPDTLSYKANNRFTKKVMLTGTFKHAQIKKGTSTTIYDMKSG